MPRSQSSGWTLSGPRKPNEPQRAAKTDPTTSPSSSAAQAYSGAARNLVRTLSASPNAALGSGRPRIVPNASRITWSAASRSSARIGLTSTALSSDMCSGCRSGKAQQRRARQVLEKLTVLERDVEVLACDARVLSRDRVGTRSLAPCRSRRRAHGAGAAPRAGSPMTRAARSGPSAARSAARTGGRARARARGRAAGSLRADGTRGGTPR